MANKYNSKIVLSNGEVLIDLTQDDVKEELVAKGIKFHDKTGAQKVGTSTKTVDASNVTAEPAEVLDGETFGKGNDVAVGTMPNNSGKGVVIDKKAGVVIPRGYFDGSTLAKLSDADLQKLIPSNIKEGVSLFDGEIVGEYGADDISAQSKQVTPTFEDQQVNPDAGYVFLSGVLVKAIPVLRQDNQSGGITVTIG